jgi:hypothetical protein
MIVNQWVRSAINELRAKAAINAGTAMNVTTAASAIQIEALAATQANTPFPASPMGAAGNWGSFTVTMGQTAFGTGESATLDVRKNGVSILTAPIVLNAASGSAVVLNETSDIATKGYLAGDEMTLNVTYVAGGTPNHPDFRVNLSP